MFIFLCYLTSCTPTIIYIQQDFPESKIYKATGFDFILIRNDTVIGVVDAAFPAYYIIPQVKK